MRSKNLIMSLNCLDGVSNKEQKISVAKKVITNLKNGDIIGVGSGSTSLIALQLIGKEVWNRGLSVKVIPTSLEASLMCSLLELPITNLISDSPDWVFDGADEVDESLNLIKGRGGAMFKEKMLFHSANKVFVLVDKSKLVKNLCTNFPIPVEVNPNSIMYVERQLEELGAYKQILRQGKGKDGPAITESGNLIIDGWFENVTNNLEKEIKSITGVIESGLFMRYEVELLLP